MRDKPPYKSRKFPIDEYHPIEISREEPPKKRGGSLILVFLTLILIVVLAVLIILIFQPTLFKSFSNIQIAKRIKSIFTSSVQEENVLPQVKENSVPSILSNEERIMELENKLVELRRQNEKLTSQVKEQEKEISSLNFKLKKVSENKSKAENEVKKLKGQIEQNKLYYENRIKKLGDNWEQEQQQLQAKLAETADELDDTKRKLTIYKSRSEKETAAVEEILRDARKAQQRIQQAEEARQKAEEEVKQLKSQLAEMERKAKEVKEGELVPLTSDVQEPKVLKSHNPRYPLWARRRGIRGKVLLRVLISENGAVLDAEVMECSQTGYGLEEAALNAIKKWEFSPAIKQGKRVRVWMNIDVNFKP